MNEQWALGWLLCGLLSWQSNSFYHLDQFFFKIFEKCKRTNNKIQSQSSKISKDKYVTLYETDTSARVREENKCGWNKNFIYCPKGELKYIANILCKKYMQTPQNDIVTL